MILLKEYEIPGKKETLARIKSIPSSLPIGYKDPKLRKLPSVSATQIVAGLTTCQIVGLFKIQQEAMEAAEKAIQQKGYEIVKYYPGKKNIQDLKYGVILNKDGVDIFPTCVYNAGWSLVYKDPATNLFSKIKLNPFAGNGWTVAFSVKDLEVGFSSNTRKKFPSSGLYKSSAEIKDSVLVYNCGKLNLSMLTNLIEKPYLAEGDIRLDSLGM